METNELNTPDNPSIFAHRQVFVEDIYIHVVSAGQADKPAILFLHGYPENWQAFEKIMTGLSDEFYTLAMNLPGIGQSGKIASNDKRTIARYVNGVIGELGLTNTTVVGHDAGGMVAYAYLKAYPETLAKAVIMNVVIPGIDPWAQVMQNPQVWHFRFNAIPDLPETLVSGKQRAFFDYFFNTISARPEQISEESRDAYVDAYSSHDALHTGFEWYRAFPQDEKDNTETKGTVVQTPVLYLRGEKEYGKIDEYLAGFREGGLTNIRGQLIPGSGHYAPEEAPDDVTVALRAFMKEE
jgi:pimeloyl-ACP methyl ester carboxylesterase